MEEIPALVQLEQWLVQVAIGGSHTLWSSLNVHHSGGGAARPLILELVAEVRQHLLLQLQSPDVIDRQLRQLALKCQTSDIIQRFDRSLVSRLSIQLLSSFR